MNIVEILPILLVIIGLLINIIFGLVYKTNFIVLMVKSIILIISLSACGISISNVLKGNGNKRRKDENAKTQPSVFEAHIPSITQDEYKSLNDEDEEFQEMNPAALYKKNTV
ncbi:hypothetical protein [Lutispora saccharofermentans]|uniref:Uncharacterized protein n=1 Tax=Lutispora saccharofermentans TaxID=3024236 RepID=A0ABT1NBG4_9FIRM|nr:hypothetical protein [Lutispora saccharofermentans]MCQ1527974.1 hypothetical protein [Lutispora saccharofermentans]